MQPAVEGGVHLLEVFLGGRPLVPLASRKRSVLRPGKIDLVAENQAGLSQIETRIFGGGRHYGDRLTEVEPFVCEPPILSAEHQRDEAATGNRDDLGRDFPGPDIITLIRTGASAGSDTEHDVGQGVLEGFELLRRFCQLFATVGDTADAVGVEVVGAHQAQLGQPHVHHDSDNTGDINDVLGLVQHDDDVVEGRQLHQFFFNRHRTW